jgi:molybdenum cofactor cytidylyltransferase
MGLTLTKALRLLPETCLAVIGAGGKTTFIFQLAREFSVPVIVTTTTHLGIWQIPLADHHLIATSIDDLTHTRYEGVTLITGPIGKNGRVGALDQDLLKWLYADSKTHNLPLLIEADGARMKPLKAPSDNEPPIPDFAYNVVVSVGMVAVGQRLSEETVYHPEIFSKLSGLKIDQAITPESIVRFLCHPQGGQKNIPREARRTILINQCDTPELQSAAYGMASVLQNHFDSVLITSLKEHQIVAVHEPVAGIILAAGGSKRYGQTKQLLDWHGQPFIRVVVKTALEAGLSPVVVITGANANQVEDVLIDLPITIKRNEDWQTGQSSSIRTGIKGVSEEESKRPGAVIFLLADQPQITSSVIRALIEKHAKEIQPIIAPLVFMEQRGNPVLFDRVTFPALMKLQGDVGGRSLFSEFHVDYLPWQDDRLLLDVDNPEDYKHLIEDETL